METTQTQEQAELKIINRIFVQLPLGLCTKHMQESITCQYCERSKHFCC